MPQLRHAANFLAAALCIALLTPLRANASISLLVEEPFGSFGSFTSTGHAAVYLDNVCADSPTRLRLCHGAELGVVISRYSNVNGYDWVAIPLIPYLYAVEDISDVPEKATVLLEKELRDRYRRAHLLDLAPSREDGSAPGGDWIQLIGASYDRHIYGFQLETTREQDEAIMARLNDSRNRGEFNLLYRNCADFARTILRSTFPGSIPRNAMADFWLTTPKHLARLVTKFGMKNPELQFQTFQIPQVPGTLPRSRRVNGIAETVVRSKKYIVPLAFFSPTTAVGLVVAYVGTGRFKMPKTAPVMAQLQTPSQPVGIMIADDRIQLPMTPPPFMEAKMCSTVVPLLEAEGGGN
ncbi:hypothetical protein [Terriglobus sp. TAA 43]|uniref:hypothetical protein n=1 Tax=Terriglobus sp. TAA 43 TaxID=278961 RepID=UPI0012EE545D|nr:hypothetical protein [Terriglobus sp. TAA 43]